jgi:hypothetical protein
MPGPTPIAWEGEPRRQRPTALQNRTSRTKSTLASGLWQGGKQTAFLTEVAVWHSRSDSHSGGHLSLLHRAVIYGSLEVPSVKWGS